MKFIKYGLRIISILLVVIVFIIMLNLVLHTTLAEWLEIIKAVILSFIAGTFAFLISWAWEK